MSKSLKTLFFGIILYISSSIIGFGGVFFELGGLVFIVMGIIGLIKEQKQKNIKLK